MKKIVSVLALISLLAVPAITVGVEQDVIPEAPFDSPDTLIDKIEDIGNWIFTGLLVLAAIWMVVAGYFFVTGGGNPEKINKAREMLIQALIGVAVGLAARGLVAVIRTLIAG